MADGSAIEWLHRPGFSPATWQVVSGCTPVSEGCRNCYSARLAGTRLKHHTRTKGLTRKAADGRYVFNGVVRCHDDQLDVPLHWRTPRMIFVADRGDLFHESVPSAFIDKVMAVARRCPRHVFLLLTKRADRQRAYFAVRCPPLPNVWCGVSVEDQASADLRLPDLMAMAAAVRWASYEPALGPVDWGPWFNWRGSGYGLGWLVAGGESGHGVRPSDPDYFRAARDACRDAGVAFFFKQWGAWSPVTYTTEDGRAVLDSTAGTDGRDYSLGKVAVGRGGGHEARLDGAVLHGWPG